MNTNYLDVLKTIIVSKSTNQREISKSTNLSLGAVNKAITNLKNEGYLNDDLYITEKTIEKINFFAPKQAIILAAGYGLRMMPICREMPKALLEINGEILIERLINQLHEIGIHKIYIIIGYMKESFEYLIDKYSVELIVNSEFYEKNNMHSLNLAIDNINNSYIVPSDIYCKKNPFSNIEMYPWYAVSNIKSPSSHIKINRNNEIVVTKDLSNGYKEIGIAYIDSKSAAIIRNTVLSLKGTEKYNHSFWEESTFSKGKCILNAKRMKGDSFYEINTYEDLLHADPNSSSLDSDYIKIICDTLNVRKNDIENIESMKSGITNKSFLFNCNGHRYIFRIPGKGTEQLISRKNEYDVYQQIKDKHLCDDIVYLNPDNGYKITKYIEDSHICNTNDFEEIAKCFELLKRFHSMKLTVSHTFDIFGQIDYYEQLRGKDSVYPDYEKTKSNVLSMKKYLDSLNIEYCLTHIDAIPDNFVISNEDIRLIDWEYSGMQDPHVDIAMFAIYALYDKKHIDKLIDIYFNNKCDNKVRLKIYCYVSMCGLLWSNWCEYKATLGETFGEYSLLQYRYAKDYYRYAKEMLEQLSEKEETIE